jgi:hypothetical protein
VLQAAQGRVQRAVRDAPEAAQRVTQLPRELIAVDGSLLEEAQDREFEHVG